MHRNPIQAYFVFGNQPLIRMCVRIDIQQHIAHMALSFCKPIAFTSVMSCNGISTCFWALRRSVNTLFDCWLRATADRDLLHKYAYAQCVSMVEHAPQASVAAILSMGTSNAWYESCKDHMLQGLPDERYTGSGDRL